MKTSDYSIVKLNFRDNQIELFKMISKDNNLSYSELIRKFILERHYPELKTMSVEEFCEKHNL